MQFRVLVKKSVLWILPLAVVFIVALNIISQWEYFILRISGFTLSVIIFSFIFFAIESIVYKRLNPLSPKKESKIFEPVFIEPESDEIEELAPVEEESDFGELLEVEDQALQPVEFSTPADAPEPVKAESPPSEILFENIEELEVFEDPVEELEAVDE